MSQQTEMFSTEVVLERFKLQPSFREYINYGDVSRRLSLLRRQGNHADARELAIEAAGCFGFSGQGWLKLYAPDAIKKG